MQDGKRPGPRVGAEIVVRLSCASVDEFLERHGGNVSRAGLYVRTPAPLPIGSRVAFCLRLASGEPVLVGSGVVEWIAERQPGPARRDVPEASGMSMRFVTLDPASRAIVELAVAARGSDAADDAPPRPPPGTPYAGPPAMATPVARPPAPVTSPPRPRARAPRIVGIDLGTTNSCVAVADANGTRVLSSKLGYSTLPSVVAYDAAGRLLVGHRAKAQMILNPHDTVYGSKRLIGRPFASPTVQACRDRFQYEIVEGAGGAAAVRIGGRVLSLQEVAAAILRELREMASQALGEDVTRAAITVPAYYNDHQRQAVREAGRIAGLRVERIVNEPTAAAVAFGFGRGIRKRVLVYDLGGGTFDASVVQVDGDVYEVVSTGGDTFLGGVDFDNRLVDHLVEAFRCEHGFAPPGDRTVWQRIVEVAEQVKVTLSSRETATAHVPGLCADPSGAAVDLRVTVTRAALERLTAPLVERTLEVCREVLRARNLGVADLDDVLLVGGQTRMPLVWRRIREELGMDPSKSVHPDEAVAIGAAILADSDTRIDSIVLLDALAISIGVGLPGGRMVPVLTRNTRLPARRTYEVTASDEEPEIELAIFQGDSAQVVECEYLGTVKLSSVPLGPRGTTVAVEFALGNEGTLSLRAHDAATGTSIPVRLAALDTPETLRDKLQLPATPVAPRGARPIVLDEDVEPGAPPAADEGNGAGPTPPPPSGPPAAEGAPAEEPPPARRSLLARLFGRS